jgi:hypothetical protein
MRVIRPILILAAAAAIAFALLSADKYGVSVKSGQFMQTYGAAFAGGFLAAMGIFMKGKAEKK